jgi:hypothetical protein
VARSLIDRYPYGRSVLFKRKTAVWPKPAIVALPPGSASSFSRSMPTMPYVPRFSAQAVRQSRKIASISIVYTDVEDFQNATGLYRRLITFSGFLSRY